MTAPNPTWTVSLARRRSQLHVGSASERVADLLRSQMLEGELRPGTQLAEERLVEALDVSRGTIREALHKLSQERLVARQPNRGMFVRRTSHRELSDMYALRRAVEVGAVREAARHIINGGLADAVHEAAECGQQAAAAGDWIAAGTANAQTHLALAGLAGNDRINETMHQLIAETRLAFLVVPDAQALHQPYVAANLSLSEHVRAGNLEQAAYELDAYLHRSEQHLVKIYVAATTPENANPATGGRYTE